MNTERLVIRNLGRQDYVTCWRAMQTFTNERQDETPDEIWLVEHDPVFTQGQNGKPENILAAGSIPIIKTDRGGQVTYHGPGQLIAYVLVDMKRKKLNVRQMVTALENAMIQLLATHHIEAQAKREAPGIYVDHKKIGSVGLRIRRGCSYHGLALNVDMDLQPFTRIHPCGYPKLLMTQVSDFQPNIDITRIQSELITELTNTLEYTHTPFRQEYDYANQTN